MSVQVCQWCGVVWAVVTSWALVELLKCWLAINVTRNQGPLTSQPLLVAQ